LILNSIAIRKMSSNNFGFKGLSDSEVSAARKQFGKNELVFKTIPPLLKILLGLIKEPMLIILFIASSIYFFTGNYGDGLFLSIAILLVASISIYQDTRSKNALKKLRNITQPNCKVIRNDTEIEIPREELVIGDFLISEEGTTVAADGNIVHSNDFSVNESILTGESFAVFKDATQDVMVKMGTTVASGLAIVQVSAIGNETALGKIGISLENISEEKTPLEKQINAFVKKMILAGIAFFIAVFAISFFRSHQFLESLMNALTLAMSILPEEIPVAFTTFMALGAWRLMKLGILVKQMKTVETLGSATVICTDKTGTITENKMSLARLFLLSSKEILTPEKDLSADGKALIEFAMWASEPIPFDPMEVALHQAYEKFLVADHRADYKMVHEYPLGGKPPMMTHIFEDETGKRIVAAKGAPEAFLPISNLTSEEKEQVHSAIDTLAKDGFRVLGVGTANFEGSNFPKEQQNLTFHFIGLVAFYDPPKANIQKVFESFYGAQINVKIVTGDNAATTAAIANQVGFRGADKSISGDALMSMTEQELKIAVSENQVFTRMFPEAKLKIINALKANGEIVAMTGDGVNDGPALKAAHIGIAMGKRGTEIAKQAASLILLEDDLSKMADAIAMGRRIYTNLKKAIRYIISIHIPIILMVFIPLALSWVYPNIFLPIHVILLELIMGPTCSIIYENEPMEKNTMMHKPRNFTDAFFNQKELTTSIIQGLFITAGTLLIYQIAVQNGLNEKATRAMVFTTLIIANIVLTLMNRSFYYSVLTTIQYKNKLVGMIIGITLFLLSLMLFIPIFANFFQFETLSLIQIGWCVLVGTASVIWYEVVKWLKRRKAKS
jgi:Ca2+-transporting ATPase